MMSLLLVHTFQMPGVSTGGSKESFNPQYPDENINCFKCLLYSHMCGQVKKI